MTVVAAPAARQAHEGQGAVGRPAGERVDADAEERGSGLGGQQQGVGGWRAPLARRRPAPAGEQLARLVGEHVAGLGVAILGGLLDRVLQRDRSTGEVADLALAERRLGRHEADLPRGG
jgi:hypothetical protein